MSGNKGMTVVEVLLALALSAVVISLLFMIFSLFTRAYENNINGMDAQYSARMVVFNINKDIRSAKQIELIGDEKIIITVEEEPLSYYLEKGTVYRHSRAKIPIAEKVVALSFNRQDSLINYSVTTGLLGYEYELDVTCGPRAVSP